MSAKIMQRAYDAYANDPNVEIGEDPDRVEPVRHGYWVGARIFVPCQTCNGEGTTDPDGCPTCAGRPTVTHLPPVAAADFC